MKSALPCVLLLSALALPAATKFDVVPAPKRAPAVELAQRLAKPAELAPLPADLKPPFNPPGFDQPDEAEERARVAAAAAAAEQKVEPLKPMGDREILVAIAERIQPSGTIILGGEPILLLRQKKVKIGDTLSVSYEGRNVEVEITEISRTTYTLRLNRAEITRPIKPGKTP